MEIKNVVVIGGGVLGSQIAYQAAYCGFNVTIWLRSEGSIGRCHLKDKRYDTYLREREVELVLEDRIDRRNDWLYHVVQKVRYATDDEHVIDRALCHGRVAFKDAA